MAADTEQKIQLHKRGAWMGGSVTSVVISPIFGADGIALAGTQAGLFRTDDGGQTWQRSMAGLDDPGVLSVVFADTGAGRPIVAFAATETGRLYRAEDMGLSWRECRGWAGLGVISALAASPAFDEMRMLFAGTTQGAFRSLDGGETWESSTFGLLDEEILCLACAPDFYDAELLWCGTAGGGFYRSRNAARAWRDAGLGLPDAAVQAIGISPHFAADRKLYVGLEDGGLYGSIDGGENWAATGSAPPGAINSLAVVDARAGTDGEENRPVVIVAGTNWGVYWSDDAGKSWTEAGGGDFLALTFSTYRNGVVLAGSYDDGLFISHDAGKHWVQAGEPLAAHAPPLVAAPTPTRLFALDYNGVVAQTVDGGQNWLPVQGETEGDTVQAAVADMPVFAMAATNIAAINKGAAQICLFLAGEAQLLRGTGQVDDPQLAWEPLTLPLQAPESAPFVVTSPTFAADTTVVWGQHNGDLYLSGDAGENWALLARPWGNDATLSVTLAADFAASRRMVAVTGRQSESGAYAISIWQSQDAGQYWVDLAGIETATPALPAIVPVDGAKESIFIASQNRLIRLFTKEGGAGLDVHQTLFDEGARITALAASPNFAQDDTVLAGINGVVQLSRDRGVTWEPVAEPSKQRPIVGLITHGPEQGFTVVTMGGIIWHGDWPAT